jgi:putative ABC transport system permease protein
VLAGLAAGLAGAMLLGRTLEGFLFGVSAFDWRLYLAAAAVVAAASILACYLPARRAAAVHPAVALRIE